MKILIATDNYPPRYDGISRFLQEIIPSLQQEHEVRVVAPDFGPTDDEWHVTKLPVMRLRVGDFHPAGLHFFTILREVRKADVVFLQALGSVGGLALLAAKLARKRIVLYTHSMEWELVPRAMGGSITRRMLPGVIKGIDRLAYGWVHLLIVPSQGISETLYWNKIESKRVVINLGVDTRKFSPAKNRAKAKQALGIEPDTFVVGYHGRLAREKDLRTLLRGYLRFKARNANVKTRLLIVGDGLREIRKMLERDDVSVTGFQEDVVPYLHAMDAYVLSSLTETSSLSVMEAMSCGLPVISTPVGYVKDYIAHEKNGFIFSERDAVTLSLLLSELATNPSLGTSLGRAARRTVSSKFSWDNTRKQILNVFSRI